MKHGDIKSTIDSLAGIKETFEETVSDAKDGKLQVGAVVRLIVLVIAWINQVAVTFGCYSVPDISPSIVYVIATVITVVASLVVYWKNNSWTPEAKVSDAILEAIRSSGVSSGEIIEAVENIIISHTSSEDEDTDPDSSDMDNFRDDDDFSDEDDDSPPHEGDLGDGDNTDYAG